MTQAPPPHLSRRESQIMDVIFELGQASAAEVQDRLDDAPSYSAVRALLRVLEDKGHLTHKQDGPRYVYLPTVEVAAARASALQHVVRTFFEGSSAKAVAALIDMRSTELSPAELERLAELIDRARSEGR